MELASTVVSVAEPTHVAQARRCGAELAVALGFDELTSGRVSIAVTEASTNLLKHARGGALVVGPTGAAGSRGIQVMAIDRGPGISDLPASLRDGYSTAGTLGTGLGAIQRSSTTFDLYTGVAGTVVAATIYPTGVTPVPTGGIAVPIAGERACGDAWAAWSAGELTSLFMSDGLGHGGEAAAASAAAVHAFQRHAERAAADVIAAVHDALRTTRGAAVALAALDQRHGSLRFCGLGNISATIVPPEGREQHLVSAAGIAGHVMRRVQEFSYPWLPGSILIMHSDGVSTRWDLAKYPGLLRRRADVIAGVLYRDHRRLRDDASVVVTRNEAPA